ncbi:MAG: hypothetical protein EA396_07965 [Anaerolineaceae bacterium]|nr:MAG: hypothetical protein EA396_07965 [Anaerolineaceae bacterium]
MNYESGVFYSKQVGYVDNVDARMWHSALRKHTKTAESPLVAVVDMQQIDRLCPTVVQVFSAALALPDMLGVIIISDQVMGSRNERVMSKLSALPGVRVFSSAESAMAYARTQLHPALSVNGAPMTHYRMGHAL